MPKLDTAPANGAVLFLQGPPSRFWSELGDAVKASGRQVLKVDFSLGEQVFWQRRGAISWRGRLQDWGPWLDSYLAENHVSDILYFADRLPYHAIAERLALAQGRRAWAIEFGYLRPDWLTLEPLAMGRRSRFPREAEAIRALAEGQPQPDMTAQFDHPFWREALAEVAWNLLNVAGRPLWPRYVSDLYYAPIHDYVAWLWRLAGEGRCREHARRVQERSLAAPDPYTLVALQLQSDYQIRASSDFDHLADMLDQVIGSLAQSAPPSMRLVVKQHPLDNGWENWPKRTRQIAERHGVADRVEVISGGSLVQLLQGAHGMITVNSTAGIEALRLGRPVLPLGDAVYDVEGLTHRSGLERFWTDPQAPDPSLVDAWVRAVAGHLQVRGSFYEPEGRQVAIAEIVRRLSQPQRYFQCHRAVPPA